MYFSLVLLLSLEEGPKEDALIQNFWDSLWFSIVTLSTVGYGDLYPITLTGKIIGLIFIFTSLGILSTIIGKVSEYFNELKEKKKMGFNGTKFEDHIVIIGWDLFTKQITKSLLDAGQKVAVITDDKEHIDLIYQSFPKKSIFVLYSTFDNYSAFEQVNIQKSKIVHLNLKSDTEELVMILNLQKIYDNLEFVIALDEEHLIDTFKSAGVTYTLSRNEFASKMIASYIFEPIVADFTTDLITPIRDKEKDEELDIQQYLVTKENMFLNKQYGELFNYIKESLRSLPIGLKKKDGDLHKLPNDDILLEEGDYVIFINDAEAAKKITSKIFKVEEGN